MNSEESTEGRATGIVATVCKGWKELPGNVQSGLVGLALMLALAVSTPAIVIFSRDSDRTDYMNAFGALFGTIGLAAALASRHVSEVNHKYSTVLYWIGLLAGVLGLAMVLLTVIFG